MADKLLDLLSRKKTLLFLIMCLAVHACNAVLFYVLGLIPFSVLNVFSTAFYALVLFGFKKNTDFYIIFTYFEIVTFSFVSELFSGGAFFYIFYVVGMISVVFYLLPPKRRMKHIFQGIGILYAIAIYIIYMKKICLFPEYLEIIDTYKNPIGLLNLCITLFTLFYISNLYFFEMNAVRDKLTYFSNHDLMTGLFNRRFFEHIMKRSKSENENEYTIAIFDIDDFKKINDTYGHHAGDYVLKTVAGILGGELEDEYVAVRWGGEEFILYMPQTDSDRAYHYLEKLRLKVQETVIYFERKKINVTVTAGMCAGRNLSEYESVIRTADDRLYLGKRNGKNQVVR